MRRITGLLCGLAVSVALPALAVAAVPTSMTVQSLLTASGGGPVADGNYTIKFMLYKDAQNGDPLWSEGPMLVAIKSGGFSQSLGLVNKLDAAVVKSAAYFTVQVGEDPELLPRRILRSVPFALSAQTAESLECSGCVTKAMLDPGFAEAMATKQDLSAYAKLSSLSDAAKSGDYADLQGLPTLTKVGTACGTGLLVRGILADGSLDCAALQVPPAPASALACDATTLGRMFIDPKEPALLVCDGADWQQVLFKPLCGNGKLNKNETCDDGNGIDSDACTNACIKAICGDAKVQAVLGEECDDGNGDDADTCLMTCKKAKCGDKITQAVMGEQCDDANSVDTDLCSNLCKNAVCGDGKVQAVIGEACDDGNAVETDACPTTCKSPKCGDKIVQPGLSEQCDDGNAIDNDGCSNTCKLSNSQACTVKQAEHPAFTTPAKDVALCGNTYTSSNIQTACAAGWSVCTLTQWNARFPKGSYPNGAQTSFGDLQSARASGVWVAGAPSNANTYSCGASLCNTGYNPWNNGKYLYNDAKSQILQGSGGCCGWDSSFSAAASTTGYAVYCCRD